MNKRLREVSYFGNGFLEVDHKIINDTSTVITFLESETSIEKQVLKSSLNKMDQISKNGQKGFLVRSADKTFEEMKLIIFHDYELHVTNCKNKFEAAATYFSNMIESETEGVTL